MEMACRRVLWGKFLNSGQTCIAPDYILCSKETQKQFLSGAKKIFEEFFQGNNFASDSQSKIVSEKHYMRLVNLTKKGTVSLKGFTDENQKILGLSIMTNVKPEDPIMQEEIFGSILPIVTVESPEKAVDFINKREKPLALYIFSNDKKVQNLFLNHTSCGGVTINDTLMHPTTENLPFGGVGSSGFGAYHGKDGFDTFTHRKGVLIRGLNAFAELCVKPRYPPYSQQKTKFLSLILKKRRGIDYKYIKTFLIFSLGAAFAYSLLNIIN